jgi:hypothetical protein
MPAGTHVPGAHPRREDDPIKSNALPPCADRVSGSVEGDSLLVAGSLCRTRESGSGTSRGVASVGVDRLDVLDPVGLVRRTGVAAARLPGLDLGVRPRPFDLLPADAGELECVTCRAVANEPTSAALPS